jgi:hypothetical protein
MSNELSDDEKKKVAETSRPLILPIAQKYELDYPLGMEALFEAFQTGVQFAIRKIEEKHGHKL